MYFLPRLVCAKFWVINVGNVLFHADENENVFDAIKKMAKANIGSVLVCNEGKVTGIFTERDYLRNIAVKGLDSAKTSIKSVMTSNLTCVTEDCALDKCLDILAAGNFRHLPVLKPNPTLGDNRLSNYVGLISVKDIMAKLNLVLSRTSHRAYLDEAMVTGSVTVGNLIHSGVGALIVSPKDTVFEAVQKMANANQGAVLVMKEKTTTKLLGIMTERDYLCKVRLRGLFSKDIRVEDIMVPEDQLVVASCKNNVSECINLLVDNHIRHLPIVRRVNPEDMTSDVSSVALLSVENVLKIAI